MKMPKIYSPSSTITFQRCPTLWYLQREGWQSNLISSPELAAALGIGFSAGMEHYFRQWGLEGEVTGEVVCEAIEIAQDTALSRITKRVEQGATLDPRHLMAKDLIPKRLEKAILGLYKRNPIPDDWTSFLTEIPLPDGGMGRPDLLVQTDMGPSVIDFKTKVTVSEWVLRSFREDFETSWQMMHYCYFGREAGIDIQNFGLILAVIEPLHFYVDVYTVDEDHLERWYTDALGWWSLMEETEEIGEAMRVGDHRDKYGLCSLKRLCVDGHQHEYNRYER